MRKQPKEVARRVVQALRSGRSYIVYPRAVGLIRVFPTVSRWLSERVIMPLLLRPKPGTAG